MRNANEPRQHGFTLIELLVVIAIIGIIISLILVAAADGVRRAEERATQALIAKLDAALNDRIDALLNTQAPINQVHRYLAAITYSPDSGTTYVPVGASYQSGSDDRRAQVIAQFDYLRAEIPDVFFLNAATSDGTTAAASYPLNFAAAPYPQGGSSPSSYAVPLGNGLATSLTGSPGLFDQTGTPGTMSPPIPTYGMFGASFSSAGGLYRLLYEAAANDLLAAGTGATVNVKPVYDGTDNDGNGMIDDYAEIVVSPAGSAADYAKAVSARLNKHTHKTARAEVLYAILVDGLSPLGSSFSSDDFTAREVQDTDGDGMPEFVDAWGEPLQFYRWPIFYGTVAGSSDSQLGSATYTDFTVPREQDPLDPNQLLQAPAWWSSAAKANASLTSMPTMPTFAPPNGANSNVSQAATAFMNYFHILMDTNPGSTLGASWDRGGGYARRAYFSRFLIVSGGPDKLPGVGQFNRDYSEELSGGSFTPFPIPGQTKSMEYHAQLLAFIENQAGQSDPLPTARSGAFFEFPATGASTTTITTAPILSNGALDDISNHNLQGVSTGVR